MRMMLRITMPVETSNRAVKDGSLPKVIGSVLEKLKPEAAYFFPDNGKRSGLFVFDLKDVSEIPMLVEPFFLSLDATVDLTPVMNADDLKSGLGKAQKSRDASGK